MFVIVLSYGEPAFTKLIHFLLIFKNAPAFLLRGARHAIA